MAPSGFRRRRAESAGRGAAQRPMPRSAHTSTCQWKALTTLGPPNQPGSEAYLRRVTAAEQPEACAALRAEADEVVCLYAPPSFSAVGNYYLRFEQTSDDEVRRLLRCEPRLASDAEAGEVPRAPRPPPGPPMGQPKAV